MLKVANRSKNKRGFRNFHLKNSPQVSLNVQRPRGILRFLLINENSIGNKELDFLLDNQIRGH